MYTYICIFRESFCFFKDLAHIIIGTSKFKICKAGNRLRNQDRVDISTQVQRQSTGRMPSSLGDISLSSIKAFN